MTTTIPIVFPHLHDFKWTFPEGFAETCKSSLFRFSSQGIQCNPSHPVSDDKLPIPITTSCFLFWHFWHTAFSSLLTAIHCYLTEVLNNKLQRRILLLNRKKAMGDLENWENIILNNLHSASARPVSTGVFAEAKRDQKFQQKFIGFI